MQCLSLGSHTQSAPTLLREISPSHSLTTVLRLTAWPLKKLTTIRRTLFVNNRLLSTPLLISPLSQYRYLFMADLWLTSTGPNWPSNLRVLFRTWSGDTIPLPQPIAVQSIWYAGFWGRYRIFLWEWSVMMSACQTDRSATDPGSCTDIAVKSMEALQGRDSTKNIIYQRQIAIVSWCM